MPLIHAEGLGKGYGGRTLFDDATFFIEEGWKVALVGPNGAGKSTLLRILAGREKADHGTLRLGEITTHWFDQHPHIPEGALARDIAFASGSAPPHMLAEKAELESRIADPVLYESPGYEEVLERYAEVERMVKAAGMAGADPNVAALVVEMGFDEAQLNQPAEKLSGGEKTRLVLARILAGARPGDLLVLDEPTNHLDVDAIEWLEEWLQKFQGTVLVVAHDRVFLDNVVDHVLEVSGGRITPYKGDYEDYTAAKQEREDTARREHEKAEAKMQAAKDIILQ
jgi:ATPase subunit of ABC transporter with duplicated ATPase domains